MRGKKKKKEELLLLKSSNIRIKSYTNRIRSNIVRDRTICFIYRYISVEHYFEGKFDSDRWHGIDSFETKIELWKTLNGSDYFTIIRDINNFRNDYVS